MLVRKTVYVIISEPLCDSLNCCRSVIAMKLFEIMIRDGHLEAFVLTTGQPVITRLTRIQANVWTHVAVRVMTPPAAYCINTVETGTEIAYYSFSSHNQCDRVYLCISGESNDYIFRLYTSKT